MDWSAIPIHPLLVAAYPVVFLFAANAADQVTLDPLWVPLAMAVGGASVVLLALALILGEWHRAALITTVLVADLFMLMNLQLWRHTKEFQASPDAASYDRLMVEIEEAGFAPPQQPQVSAGQTA